MTDAAPKFEDEVKSRRSIRNKESFDGGFQRTAYHMILSIFNRVKGRILG